MKQKDLKKCSNDELREIMQTIKNNGMAKLPLELQEYINTDKPVGNEMTRAWRLFKLCEEEVVKRFMCNELIKTNTLEWVEGRIAALQSEYDSHDEFYHKTDGANDVVKTLMASTLGKLKGYKEVLAYMLSHNVE